MNQKVTYLFGAGASAESLPIYSNFKARFDIFFSLIEQISPEKEDPAWNNKTVGELKAACKMLHDELQNHTTPDIVAKKYFIQNEVEKLYRLKAILTTYFFFEQTCQSLPNLEKGDGIFIQKPIIDPRYDQFISRLLKPIKGKWLFEDGVNILSWNYDCQFEMCSKLFTKKAIDDQNELFISHPSPFIYWDGKLNNNAFKLLHLNGVAMASNKEPQSGRIADCLTEKYEYESYPKQTLVELFHFLVFSQENLLSHPNAHLFFGWEKLDEFGMPGKEWPIGESVKATCSETDVLVIVGYSFPSFNQAIDSFLFQNFNQVHTIYVQDSSFSNIKGILDASLIGNIPASNSFDIQVIDVGYTNQFFIPRGLVTGKQKMNIKNWTF